ncbi:MAG: S8 family serine peptidase [Acidobacteriota bacterium]
MKRVILILILSALICASGLRAGTFREATRDGIPGQYIVVLRESSAKLGVLSKASPLPTVAEAASGLAKRYGISIGKVWDRALRGFVMQGTEDDAKRLAAHPWVESVEQSFEGKAEDLVASPVRSCYSLDSYPWGSLVGRPVTSASPQTITCVDSDPTHDLGSTTQAPQCRDNWGLDRIDQRSSVRDGLYTFDRTGRVPGVTHPVVMFLDLGLNARHQEFIGLDGRNRAAVIDMSGDRRCPIDSDTYGHGTHVASIAAGRTFGVAKDVDVLMIKATDCNLAYQADWVISALNTAAYRRPGVLSWSGGNSQLVVSNHAIRTAVQGVVNSGVAVIQAAGNQSSPYVIPGTSPAAYPTQVEDACSWTFGSVPGVIVVGGVDQNGSRWTRHLSGDLAGSFCPPPNCVPSNFCLPTECRDQFGRCLPLDCGSNVGTCVDLWAPAANILAAAGPPDDSFSYCRLSGTSMAAPHVAGVVALYLQAHPAATPAEVEAALKLSATAGVLNINTSSPNQIGPGSPNLLLYSKVP